MPYTGKVPTVDDFLKAASDAIHGQRDALADTRTAGGLDVACGFTAMLWAEQARRDAALFLDDFVATARGTALSDKVTAIYRVGANATTYGQGVAILQRPAPGLVGTIYQGTRVKVTRGVGVTAPPVFYVAAADTDVQATDTTINVPVRAARAGSGTSMDVSDPLRLSIDDPIFDATFAAIALVCADGTDEEDPHAYIARARQTQRDNRIGFERRIRQACLDAGAANVVLLPSSTFGAAIDFGLNHVHVADAGYSTSTELLRACVLALESVRVCGCDIVWGGMAPTPITSCTVDATLWTDPNKIDVVALRTVIVQALLAVFVARANFWTFKLNELQAAVQRASRLVQSAVVTTTPTEPTPGFVTTLPRYTLVGSAIHINLFPPS